jgi:predicted SAM-dependent methyltransferase
VIGGFYPKILPHYASDYEFTIRARRKGMQLVSDSLCWLKVDQTTTGFRELSAGSLRNIIGNIFSNKSVQNPFMWTVFIILSCPCQFMLKNLFRVWLNFLGTIYQTIRFWVTDKKIKLGASKTPLRVIFGAGVRKQKGWLSTDITHLDILLKEDWQRYFKEGSIDAMFAEHVWEHLTEAEAAARNCFAYLKPGSYLRVAVPDGFHPSREYRDAVRPMGSGPGSDDHKVLFTHISLSRVFESAGFEVELLEYFDESGEFYHKEWESDAGHVKRSMRFDERNGDGNLNHTSIILDAWKKMD